MSKSTLGPIIGKVTSSTARILLELDSSATVTCHAKAPGGHSVQAELQFERNSPRAFLLEGLEPEEQYSLTFEGAAVSVSSSFRAMPEAPESMNVVAVSCNKPHKMGKTDLWADLGNRFVSQGSVDLLLHMGDQVYADKAFHEAIEMLGTRIEPTKTQERRILESYRALYRKNWGRKSTREVMANVSNLMIWDDHEVRDDWGSKRSDWNPLSREFAVGRLARRVFREYQRQLWDCGALEKPIDGFEDHFHVWGSFAALFVDQRGGRTFGRDDVRPYLGKPQWDRLKQAFGPNGALEGVRALVVVTSVPLAYLGDGATNNGSSLIDDLKDHWSHGVHNTEQLEFIRLLRQWKSRRPEERELLVVGGDVHIGCETSLEYKGKQIFKQLICSPITNKPPSKLKFWGLRTILEAEEGIGDRYSFEHKRYTRKRNYGFITVRSIVEGKPVVSGSLVKA